MMDNVTDAVYQAVVDQVRKQAKEGAELAIRYGLSYVQGLVEQRTGATSMPSNVWNAVAPIVAELATASIDGSLIDPETGKLNRQVRAEFEVRVATTLDEFGFLQTF